MRYISKWLFFILLIFTWLPVSPGYSVEKIPSSPTNNQILHVGVIPLEPFAMVENGKPRGISIELWEEIARVRGWQYKYKFLPETGYLDVEPLLQAHKLDFVIGPIAISYHRINEISFSTPYYITTSNLVTKDTPSSSYSPFLIHFFQSVFSLPIIILFLIVLTCSFLIWMKERRHYPDRFPQSFYKGIPYSIWYGLHSIFSSDIFLETKDTYSRVLTIVMLVCSVSLVTIGASSLTSSLTLSHMKLSENISDLGKLRHQPVAIISGTNMKRYVHNLDFTVVSKDSLHGAIQSLKNEEVVAVIADKLLVGSYLREKQIYDINVTDIIVRSNILAFAMPKESELRGPVNDTIVHLQNSHWIYKMCLSYLSRHEAAFCTM